ncbi:MAG: thiamine-phosphate kinase [Hyphomicrobium sp.]
MSRELRGSGEEALIAAYFAPLAASFEGAHHLLDDCASLRPAPGQDLVLTTDAVAAGVHFFADDPAGDIAWKALAVNVSDLVAKGARPVCYLMSVAFPERPAELWLEAFAKGLAAAQSRFGIVLAGGDTDRRPGPMAITITAVGELPHGRMVRRTTGRPGDLLFVSGQLGSSALGLRLRRDPALAFDLGLTEDETSGLVGRYLRPEPRIELVNAVREHASASMDISDGLAKDLGRLVRASGVGALVETQRLPLSPAFQAAAAARADIFSDALAGGDDYEVLAAVSPDAAERFRLAASAASVPVTSIGEITEGPGVRFVDGSGSEISVGYAGWDHFA